MGFAAVVLSFAAMTFSGFLWWGAALPPYLLGVLSLALWRGLRRAATDGNSAGRLRH
ncbi:hypothetical protein [Agromyces sp. Soil535]|uniref:hypothetical protein n=1 Tax=Agromyces sp. Soil535 TaxID=1736390 RepID=UPI0012E3CD29|nr:hypothetical protein [Agromyces sp. Soil535]